jgi:hypothetical protein
VSKVLEVSKVFRVILALQAFQGLKEILAR